MCRITSVDIFCIFKKMLLKVRLKCVTGWPSSLRTLEIWTSWCSIYKKWSVKFLPRKYIVRWNCISYAIGNAIPPYYIFPGKKFDRSLLVDGTPAGSDGQCSQTGWSNSDTFKTYLEKHFLKYAKDVNTGNPTHILFDGHRSHISHTSQMGWIQKLLLFVLSPHCSHILQPLDVACFRPMKSFYTSFSRWQGFLVGCSW
jgi:hypothetical protein